MVFADRLKQVRRALSLSQKDLAALLEVSPTTYHSWESGRTSPNATILEKLCSQGVNGHWLLTGSGSLLSAEQAPSPDAGNSASGLKATMATEAHEAEQDLGLGEVATLARLGRGKETWEVMSALLRAHPQGLRLEELNDALDFDPREVSSNVALLRRLGSVEEVDGRFRLLHASHIEQLHASSLPDRHQGALFAASSILQTILPAIEKKDGRLTLLKGRTCTGRGRQLLGELSELVMSAAQEAGAEPGEDEAFTVVFGVAVSGQDE